MSTLDEHERLANAWKRRAETAEAKLEEYARRQDEMAAQIERLREELRWLAMKTSASDELRCYNEAQQRGDP